jgi:hypothetical protein
MLILCNAKYQHLFKFILVTDGTVSVNVYDGEYFLQDKDDF